MAAIAVGSTACNVYLFLKSRSDQRFDKVNSRLDEHAAEIAQGAEQNAEAFADVDKKIAVMAKEIDNLPTHDDLDGIRSDITLIKSGVAAVQERSGHLVDSVRRIENHLLNRYA
jgi:hypothetical protein